jgi:hypothetical protein
MQKPYKIRDLSGTNCVFLYSGCMAVLNADEGTTESIATGGIISSQKAMMIFEFPLSNSLVVCNVFNMFLFSENRHKFFLICFRLCDRSTFDKAAQAFDLVDLPLQKPLTTATILLVGTHSSLSSDTQHQNMYNKKPQRQVTYEEGVSLARELPGGAIYMETDIEDEFTVLRMIRRLID